MAIPMKDMLLNSINQILKSHVIYFMLYFYH